MMSSLIAELPEADHLKLITANLTVRLDPDGPEGPDGTELDDVESKPSRCGEMIIDSTWNIGLAVSSVMPCLNSTPEPDADSKKMPRR